MHNFLARAVRVHMHTHRRRYMKCIRNVYTTIHANDYFHHRWTVAGFEAVQNGIDYNLRECVVCLDAMSDHIILNCMHICLCEDCAEMYRASKQKECPKCRGRIKSIRHVY